MRALALLLAFLGCHRPQPTHPQNHVPSIVDHGTPVVTSRQWTTALSPNAAGTGWNFIACTWPYGSSSPFQWNIVKGLTGTPAESVSETSTGIWPNSNFQISNQLRAQNGRIFFPARLNYTQFYDPTTEDVHLIGPIVESPPINPNASTALYSASFDVGGLLYMGTQESQNRPAMISVTDTVTLVQTVLGYVGDSAQGYTTYAYYIAPDTVTATKFIYVAYGKDPWQLWALNITPGPNFGVATKLYEVTSTGNIFFTNIAGQGWVATIDTKLGKPDNVRVQKWCLDGAIYDYTVGVGPPVAARNVTPASNPLVNPPTVDASKGSGVVRWRAYGSSGAYTTVNYSVAYATPITLESLVDYSDGVVGNADQYSGFVQYGQTPGTLTWFGSYATISRGPRLNVDGLIYAAGYPNGVLVRYDPAAAWDGSSNPIILGYVGLQGLQYAGIKYADYMAWAPNAGSQGQLYICGRREREGIGSGIGAWKKASNGFIGVYSSTDGSTGPASLNTVNPSGIAVLSDISRVVMASQLITPPGSAPLYVFGYDLNLIAEVAPIAGLTNLGQIYDTSTSGVIVGIVQGSGNSLGLWKYNVTTQTLVTYVELGITGTLGLSQYRRAGTFKVHVMMGNNLVRVDLNSLTAEVVADLTAAAPVNKIALGGDGATVYIGGGTASGVSGAKLYSLTLGDVIVTDSLDVPVSGGEMTFTNGGSTVLALGSLDVPVASFPIGFNISGSDGEAPPGNARTADHQIALQNDDGSVLLFGQPVYSSGPRKVRLACADDAATSTVVGIVGVARLESIESGVVRTGKTVTGSAAQWDAVCGTSGGLVRGTTYYLHPSIPGRLTSTPPSSPGQQLVRVIHALSDVMARVVISAPVPL